MFTWQHFVWLAISVVIVLAMLFIQKRFKLSFDVVLTIMCVMSVLSEVVKILCNMEEANYSKGGMILDPGDLPFHLCSIQIFLMFTLKFLIKKPSTKEHMLAFMCPSMIIGAVLALFIPTVGVQFEKVQVYQYFIFHAFLIFFAIYILKEKLVKWTWSRYPRNLACLGGLALFSMWMNSILSGVLPRTNFMYLVRPPMENLPILNLDHGWYAYFATLAVLAVVLIGIFHVIVTLLTNRRKAEASPAKEETAE